MGSESRQWEGFLPLKLAQCINSEKQTVASDGVP